MAKSLARNSFYTLTANVALAMSNWLFLVVIAKQYSSLTLGQFALSLSIVSPAFLFASFKVRTLLIVDNEWRFKLEEYANARLLANLVVSLLIALMVSVLKLDIPLYMLGLVLVYKWLDAWTEFCQSYLRRVHLFELPAISLLTRSIVTMLCILLSAYKFDGFEAVILVWVLCAACFASLDSWLLMKKSSQYEIVGFTLSAVLSLKSCLRSLQLYREYITVAVALVISSLFVYLPNFVLHQKLNVEAAGQFATISYFLVAGGILINSVSQAATPQLAHYFKSGERQAFSLLVIKMCILGICIGLCGVVVAIFFGKFFLQLFYNEEIAGYADVLVWVMLAAGLRYVYIFLGTALASLQKFKIQTRIYACGLFAMLIACVLLIDKNGLAGAGQAMLIATLVEFILFVIVAKKQFSNAFDLPRQNK